MQNQYGVRKFLNDQGYKDDDIQWDQDRQMVTLQGKDFFKATPQQDGKTYGSMSDLNAAMGNFNNLKRNQNLNTLTDTMMQKAQAPVQQFSFNPETDPLMQAATRNAAVNANRASNNAMVGFGARGIGNSSATTDRVAQIQQQAYGELTDRVMPQIAQMSHDQYMANQGLENQKYNQLASLVPLISGLNQQDFNNKVTEAGLTGTWNGQNTMDKRRANMEMAFGYMDRTGNVLEPVDDWRNLAYQTPLGRTMAGQGLDHGFQQDAIKNNQWQQGFDREGQQWNKEFGLRERQTNANISNMNSDNSRQQENFNVNRLMEVWKNTGKAPAGLEGYGIQPGTPYNYGTKEPASKGIDSHIKSFNDLYVAKDPMSGKPFVTDPQKLRQAIISLNLDDQETIQILSYYGIPIQQ